MVLNKIWHKINNALHAPSLTISAKKFAWGCGVLWLLTLFVPFDSWLAGGLLAPHSAWGKSHQKKIKTCRAEQ